MLYEQSAPAKELVPLFVDVDGTLIRADISVESFVRLASSSITGFFAILFWLIKGRAIAKALAARRDKIDAARLPYRQEVLALIEQAKADGRPVILASASHWKHVRHIAKHLNLPDAIIATHGRNNLKGQAKLAAIKQRIGADKPFDYVGDSRADSCIWQAARQGWSVGYMPSNGIAQRLGDPPPNLLRTIIKAMRPHQWTKNALVLVPAFTSGHFIQPFVVLTALVAALLMSLIASSIYLLNDLLDIDADRAHRTKCKRPIAFGALSIPAALVLSVLLATIGLSGGWFLGGWKLMAALLVYLVITTAYSLRLKAAMVGDAIVLASLFTIRVWVGAVAIAVDLSFWLLLFSVFVFLDLAYLKRYIEMRDAVDPKQLIKGRGYVGGDLDVVMMSGISSGMVATLVLMLFAHDQATSGNYAVPELLWLLCLPLIYWLNRIWMMARRGQIEGDPVAFAIKDRRSLLIGVTMACIFAAALYAPVGIK